jgi:uncharacterized protein YndB with AHSA1/START domain
MPMKIERSVVIARPVEEVWSFVADPRNDPKWCHKVASVEQVGGDGVRMGARYRVVHRPVRLKKPQELTVTVEEVEPPVRMRLREEDETGIFNVTYDLVPTTEGTRFTQRDEIEWKIPKFQLPIARVMVSRDIERQLMTLKRQLES